MKSPAEIKERIIKLETLIEQNHMDIKILQLSCDERDAIEYDTSELSSRIKILKWVLDEK